MHNTFYIYKRAVFTAYMTISIKDAFTPDRILWNRYETDTDKPCAYMGPGSFALDPFPFPYEMDSNDDPV